MRTFKEGGEFRGLYYEYVSADHRRPGRPSKPTCGRTWFEQPDDAPELRDRQIYFYYPIRSRNPRYLTAPILVYRDIPQGEEPVGGLFPNGRGIVDNNAVPKIACALKILFYDRIGLRGRNPERNESWAKRVLAEESIDWKPILETWVTQEREAGFLVAAEIEAALPPGTDIRSCSALIGGLAGTLPKTPPIDEESIKQAVRLSMGAVEHELDKILAVSEDRIGEVAENLSQTLRERLDERPESLAKIGRAVSDANTAYRDLMMRVVSLETAVESMSLRLSVMESFTQGVVSQLHRIESHLTKKENPQ